MKSSKLSNINHLRFTILFFVIFFFMGWIQNLQSNVGSEINQSISLSKDTLAQLRDPKSGGMKSNMKKELINILNQHFGGIIKSTLGGGAKIQYDAVTTLASRSRNDWKSLLNRLDISASIQAPSSDGGLVPIHIFMNIYINERHPEYFTGAAANLSKNIRQKVEREKKLRKKYREQNKPFKSRLLTLGSYIAIPHRGGWQWHTKDAQMSIVLRPSGRGADAGWIKSLSQKLHAKLAGGGLYSFRQKLFQVRVEESKTPPRIEKMVIEQRHLSFDKAEVKITAHAVCKDIRNYSRGDIDIKFRINDEMHGYSPGQQGFIISGSKITVTHKQEITRAGQYSISIYLIDRKFKNELNPRLDYEDRLRGPVVTISHPSAKVFGTFGDVNVCRKNLLTRSQGITIIRNTAFVQKKNEAFEKINFNFLYEGDQIRLGEFESSISLEWKGGVKGKAYFPGWRRARYTVVGEFTIGLTRGFSGEITARWKKDWGDYYQVLFDMAEKQAYSTMRKKPVEWLLKKIPRVGIGLAKRFKNLGVFSWHAGGTVLSDVKYIELNSEVYIKHDESGALKVYTLEGNPVLYYNNGRSNIQVNSNQMAVVAPGKAIQTNNFNRSQLDPWWNRINYKPISKNISNKIIPRSNFKIPSLQANVSKLNLYESGSGGLEKNQRQYKTQFLKPESRFIRWELNLKHPAPGRRKDFQIEAVYYNPDGSVFSRSSVNTYLKSEWTTSYHNGAWGWKDPGNWKPGTYRIELYIEGKKVASKSFEISGSGGKFSNSTYDISSLQANVTGVNIYEAGSGGLEKNQRQYKTQFTKSESRFIRWELNLKHPAPGQKKDFQIEAVYYNPDGSVFGRSIVNTYLKSEWTTSYHNGAWGWKDPGNWKPGTYRLELFIERKKVASKLFVISDTSKPFSGNVIKKSPFNP